MVNKGSEEPRRTATMLEFPNGSQIYWAVRSISKEVPPTVFPCLHRPTAIWLQRTSPQVLLICLVIWSDKYDHRCFFLRIPDTCADGEHRRPCLRRKFYHGKPMGKSSRAFVLTCNLPCLLTLNPTVINSNELAAAVPQKLPAAWPGRAGRIWAQKR